MTLSLHVQKCFSAKHHFHVFKKIILFLFFFIFHFIYWFLIQNYFPFIFDEISAKNTKIKYVGVENKMMNDDHVISFNYFFFPRRACIVFFLFPCFSCVLCCCLTRIIFSFIKYLSFSLVYLTVYYGSLYAVQNQNFWVE